MGSIEGESTQGARPPTILVVEDEPMLCELLQQWLEHEGYRVFSANSGRAAVETAQAEHPDLITLDLTLPDMTGDDVLAAIRGQPALAKVPVVVLSGQEPLPRPEGQVVGALLKPFNVNELGSIITRALGRPAT